MGQARWHKKWPSQRPRHVWVRPPREAGAEPKQGLLVRWQRGVGRTPWLAVVLTVDGEDLHVDVVPADHVAPVESDPNKVLSRDAAVMRGLRRPR